MASSRIFPFVAFVSFTGALAGLLFGMDTGAISGALPILERVFDLNKTTQGALTAILMLGAAAGAVCAAILSYRFGRKRSLLMAAFLFVVGAGLCGVAPNVATIMGGRLLLGFAIGIASFTAPLYLSEIAPERYRGAIISLYQLMITIGILMAFVLNTALTNGEFWRWMLGASIFPALCFFCAVLFLPRSPHWLVMHNRLQEARQILGRLNQTPQEADHKLEEIRKTLSVKQEGWRLFQKNANFRRAVGLGIGLQLMQQFTGINIVMYFSPKIFQLAGYASDLDRMWLTVTVGLVNVLVTLVAILLIDRWGRRPILFLGFLTMAVGMASVGIVLGMAAPSGAWQMFGVVMLLVFVAGFALSAGPIVWVLCSEIQPLKGRDFGIMCSTTTNWLSNMLITFAFLPILDKHGGGIVFLCLALLNVVFIVLTWFFVPETKGVTLEQIETNLMSGKALRHIGTPAKTSARTPAA